MLSDSRPRDTPPGRPSPGAPRPQPPGSRSPGTPTSDAQPSGSHLPDTQPSGAQPPGTPRPRRLPTARRPAPGLLAARVALWLFGLAPAAVLAWRAITDDLTANPIEFITLHTGWWALVMLVATLAVTPLRRITRWNPIIKLRRPLGLFAFFYATLHLITYISLDRYFEFGEIGADILDRPYITVGFAAFVLMLPLAITSTKGWIRRLGKRWSLLHRLIYVSGGLAVLHYYWKKSSKSDIAEPLTFAAILAVLLLFRVGWWLYHRKT